MEKKEKYILDEAIKSELLMSKLYSFFQKNFSEDSEFWGELATEEKSHAHIIMKLRPFLKFDKNASDKFTEMSLLELKENNRKIQNIIEKEKIENREHAFIIAKDLENISAEAHYRMIMNSETESEVLKVFQNLNGEDKKHYCRILTYISDHKINLKK